MPMLVQQTAQLLAFPGRGISLRAALTPALKHHRLPEQMIEASSRSGQEVLSWGLGTQGQRHSPLKQVNTGNVARLVPAWGLGAPGKAMRSALPLRVESATILHLP